MNELNTFSKNAKELLTDRYLIKDIKGNLTENIDDLIYRVAGTVAGVENPEEVDKYFELFRELLNSKRFIPNSPTLMNAGKEKGNLSACFVIPVEDNMAGIFEAVKKQALVQKSGGKLIN